LGLRNLGIATVVLFLLVVALGCWFKYDSIQKDKQIHRQTAVIATLVRQNVHALCAFRQELASRIPRQEAALARSKAFLLEHPDGIPGISVNLIRAGIADDAAALKNLHSTVDTLKGLPCVDTL
jgi:hypothetical protein